VRCPGGLVYGKYSLAGRRGDNELIAADERKLTGPSRQRQALPPESLDRGWRDDDRLSFAVVEADDSGGYVLPGNVGLKNREETGLIGERETAEIGYWTAVAARVRGVAPAAVRAVTDWIFDAFAGASLWQIMLVHDVGNRASCRVAEKAGYPVPGTQPGESAALVHRRTHPYAAERLTRVTAGPSGGSRADQIEDRAAIAQTAGTPSEAAVAASRPAHGMSDRLGYHASSYE
jgi:RimJ/RimL family protein N-acetyltransferase